MEQKLKNEFGFLVSDFLREDFFFGFSGFDLFARSLSIIIGFDCSRIFAFLFKDCQAQLVLDVPFVSFR
jgi:hypothetical protein